MQPLSSTLGAISLGMPSVRNRPASRANLKLPALFVGMTVVLASQGTARADIVAAYIQGQGGLSSPDTGTMGSGQGMSPGVGVQAGARLLIFEAYGDHTAFGSNASVTRGILGLRGAVGFGKTRLILRGGGGVLAERGGILTGQLGGAPDRTGVVGRAGIALERQVAPTLLFGGSLEGEIFNLAVSNDAPVSVENRVTGSDVFFSLHLKFEIGI